MRGGNFITARKFTGILGGLHQLGLETGIRNAKHGRDHILIRSAAQVGHAIFGDDDVAQMTRDRLMPINPADVRCGLAAGRAGRAQHDNRARIRQCESLFDEIVLSADAADHTAIFQPI